MRISDWSSDVCSSDLWTTIELNSSEAKTLKSNARSRLAEAPSVEVAIVSMPLTRTRVNCAPRPRTVIARPSPASRSIETPGMRWSDSARFRSEEHTSELQSLMRIRYAVLCLKKQKLHTRTTYNA